MPNLNTNLPEYQFIRDNIINNKSFNKENKRFIKPKKPKNIPTFTFRKEYISLKNKANVKKKQLKLKLKKNIKRSKLVIV